MQSAKLNTLYFALTVLFAVAAACATCLVVPRTRDAQSVALEDSVLPMDARVALAR
jgi:hypothetical protein